MREKDFILKGKLKGAKKELNRSETAILTKACLQSLPLPDIWEPQFQPSL